MSTVVKYPIDANLQIHHSSNIYLTPKNIKVEYPPGLGYTVNSKDIKEKVYPPGLGYTVNSKDIKEKVYPPGLGYTVNGKDIKEKKKVGLILGDFSDLTKSDSFFNSSYRSSETEFSEQSSEHSNQDGENPGINAKQNTKDDYKNLETVRVFDIRKFITKKIEDDIKYGPGNLAKAATENLELKIAEDLTICPQNTLQLLKTKIHNFAPDNALNWSEAATIFDHTYQESMACTVEALLDDGKEEMIPILKLENYISSITQIGENSIEGNALLVQLDNNPMYVVKVSQEGERDGIAHEAIIGMLAINNLRSQIPNFVHTYATFKCAPPILVGGHASELCPMNARKVTHVVLENIKNSITLNKFMKTADVTDFLSIYLQIVNALNIAQKAYDFTHYDLHGGNVLIVEYPYEITIPIYLENGSVLYLVTKLLAKIIDYGFAHARIQDIPFSRVSVAREKHPSYDAYRVLYAMYYSAKARNNPNIADIKTVATPIHQLTGDNLTLDQKIVAKRQPGSLPGAPENGMLIDMDYIIESVVKIVNFYNLQDKLFVDNPESKLYVNCVDDCIGFQNYQNYLFDDSLPVTLDDYAYALIQIMKLPDSGYKARMLRNLKTVDLDSMYERERENIYMIINLVNNDIKAKQKISNIEHMEINRHLLKLRVWTTSAMYIFQSDTNKTNEILGLIAVIRGVITDFLALALEK